MRKTVILLMCLSVIGISSCKQKARTVAITNENAQDLIQEQLINATEGATIDLPEGNFAFSRSLSLDGIANVTIKGAGKGKTIMSFLNQTSGAEGLLIKADGITLEGFTIQDSKGDAIKIQDSKNVIIRDVEVTWTQGAKEENGAYGLYPVSCTNVLMENCEASYSSDAGIYVGQSTNVIVRNNYAHHNVAGIEIENCRNVEAYGNKAENNTGGFLIFDMPNLPQANGYNVKAYNNEVLENNFKNFSPEGGIVNILPPGTGMLIVGHNDVEVYNNKVIGHKTIGFGVVSYLFTRRPFKEEGDYNPYYSGLHIHDNVIERKKGVVVPDVTKEFGQMVNALFPGKPQDIVIDGIFDPQYTDENGKLTGDRRVCIRNNGEDIRFVNLNANGAEKVGDLKKSLNRDLSIFDCELPSIDIEEELKEVATWLN